MKRTEIVRFALLGVAGFGVGGTILGAVLALQWLAGPVGLPLLILGGLIGGASLGLALKDGKKAIALALLGALGFAFGISVAFILGFIGLVPQSELGSLVAVGLLAGAMGGASLGLALWDWTKIMVLALAGGVGFGAGATAGYFLQGIIPGDSYLLDGSAETMILFAVTGIIAGASLGTTLGYLERAVQRPHGLMMLRITALGSVLLLGGAFALFFIVPYANICGGEERSALSEFPHYGGIEKEPQSDPESGGCAVFYNASAPPEEVAAYFGRQLEGHGWEVEHQLKAKADGSEPTGGTLVTAQRDGLRYDAVYESLEFYKSPRSGTHVAVHVFEDRRR